MLDTRAATPSVPGFARCRAAALPFISPEGLALFIICTLDALSSAFLFHFGLATEANPLLRWAAEAGTWPFLAAKGVSFIPALLLAEWYGRHRPDFVRPWLRRACFVYLAVYAVLVGRQFLG